MENIKIRKYFERKSEDVQEILIKIVDDFLKGTLACARSK